MLLSFIRFLRGYVTFCVEGRFPERFLNIAARHGIHLWDVRRGSEEFSACMYMSDYRRVRRRARDAGVVLHITRKDGMPTYIRRYRDRAGVLIGMFAFMLAIFVMSLFIWSIDISGLDTVSRSEMLSLLRTHGLYVGAFKPSLDFQEVSRAVMLDKHEVGWMAVNVTGSYASVEIKEEYAAPEVMDVTTPANVKAARDGTIVRIDASQGATAVKDGSGVAEGQLLVSGVMDDEQGGVRLVHAQAEVFARTCRRAEFSLPERFTALIPDGETVGRQSLSFLGLHIPLTVGAVTAPDAVSYAIAEAPAPLGIELPVSVITEQISALRPHEIQLDDNSAEELLSLQSALYELFVLRDAAVSSDDRQLTHTDTGYVMHVAYDCIEDIAVTETIGTDAGTDLSRSSLPTETAP